MPLTQDAVLAALSTVEEPDLKDDLVTLGMIRDLVVEGDAAAFTVMLTTPACPLKELIRQRCETAIHRDCGEHVTVSIQMEADTTTPEAQVAQGGASGVKNFIAVASGKGGVGKSTVAANLAVALAEAGARVGLLDIDVYGPSVPVMFGIAPDEKPRVNEERKIIPLVRYGVKLLSMGFLVDPKNAVVWRGPMASSAVKQFVNDAVWGELDYLIIDLPPGTGDIQLTLVQTVPVTGTVIVSTPQEVALTDARKGIKMFEKTGVPVLGIVENMAYFTPPDLPDRKYFLFGQAGAQKLAAEMEVPLLAEIPLEQATREAGDLGAPVTVREPDSLSAGIFRELAGRVAQEVSIRNAEAPATQQIEILHR